MSSQTPVLEAQPRTKLGTRYAIRLRETGQLPAVLYGHKQDPVHMSIDARKLGDILHHGAHLIEVQVDGKAEPCLIKDVQYDYLDTTPIHVDLTRVDLNEEVEIELEVEFTGQAVGLKEAGAMLDHPQTTIVVKCKASAIPDSLTHDISELAVGESIHVSDLSLAAGITAVTDGETMLAHIIVQAAVAETTDEDAASGNEPEVIGGEKKEDGQDAGE